MNFYGKQNKKRFLTLLLTVALVGFGALTLAPTVSAATWFRLVPECATIKGEPGSPPPTPSLTCVLQTFGNISQIILGLTGSLALLMFVYGGFLLVTSGGSQEKVAKGKKAITNAVIGIFIIMTSGLIIQYGLDTIELNANYKAIGMHCGAENKGQYVQLQNGELKCAATCTDLGSGSGFSCLVVTGTGPGVGKYCIPNLCPGARDKMCCYTPPAAP